MEPQADSHHDIGVYLTVMVRKSASDLFLYTGAKPTLKGPFGFVALGQVLRPGDTVVLLQAMLPDAKMAEFESKGELDFSFSINGVGRFRGNAFRQRGETSIVMRYVKADIPTIEGLGLPLVLRNLVELKNGMVVVSGATGSGKSTTLAAMIDHRNSNMAGNIITLEDPIEFIHQHKKSLVAQREIGTDTASFDAGMRAAMREAPDVILLGEIRDIVSMEYALRFANTGQLCLSTVHANTAVSTLERMLSFFDNEAREQETKRIAQNLRAIVCQRLVPRVGGGKVAALEILVNTMRIKDLITRGDYEAIKGTMEQGRNYGMQTFDQALCDLFDAGVIDEQAAEDHANSKTQVIQHIKFNAHRQRLDERVESLQLQEIQDNRTIYGADLDKF